MDHEGSRGVGRDAIVGARPPLGGLVLQRASVGDGFKQYVSAQGQININHQEGSPPHRDLKCIINIIIIANLLYYI